jgi:uncharacterized protein YcbK (DUF882 family)
MKLTENFSRAEFDCNDGTPVPQQFITNVKKLAEQLQILRDHIKEPVMITGSGYRTPSHNTKVGGAKNSQHLTASGADINAKNYTPRQLANVIEKLIKEKKMLQGGIGVYKGFVHYDIRGTKARW